MPSPGPLFSACISCCELIISFAMVPCVAAAALRCTSSGPPCTKVPLTCQPALRCAAVDQHAHKQSQGFSALQRNICAGSSLVYNFKLKHTHTHTQLQTQTHTPARLSCYAGTLAHMSLSDLLIPPLLISLFQAISLRTLSINAPLPCAHCTNALIISC